MMQGSTRGYSLVQDTGPYRSSCGYCNDESGSSGQAHGMHAYRLTVYDYQELLDQGWRRSGKYLYKPDNEKTCCRQYTIRLKVADFQPSKPHKKLLRKWEQFLAGHIRADGQQAVVDADMSTSNHAAQQQNHQQQQQQQQYRSAKRSRNSSNNSSRDQPQQPAAVAAADQAQQQQSRTHHAPQNNTSSNSQTDSQLAAEVQTQLQQAVQVLQQSGQLPWQQLPPVKVIIPHQQKPLKSLPSGTVLTSSSAHQLAAAVRKSKQQQQRLQSADAGGSVLQQQWIESAVMLADALAAKYNALSNLSLAAIAVNGYLNFVRDQQHAVPQDQQQKQQQPQAQQQQQQDQIASGSAQQQQQQQQIGLQLQPQQEQHNNIQQHNRQHNGHHDPQHQQQQQRHLEIRMVPSHFVQEEYELYCKYQITQHHDDPEDLTPSRYRHFLVDTPLIPVLPQQQQQQQGLAAGGGGGGGGSGIPPCGYGSFHQQYWLDGKLIAVGVVDILPRCLSSKYFFWDPDYAWLSLGRYGALREINWVAAAHAAGAADLEYYYLGYYIHNCPKMSYKAEYAPSELLCPKRQVWVKLNQTVLQALHESPYVILSDLPGVHVRPNLSVPRQLDAGQQAAAAAAATQDDGQIEVEQQEQPSQQHQQDSAVQQQQLHSQLVFLLKQPVRWGALRDSGLLDEGQIGLWEERLMAWRRVVGETAAYLLYATPGDLLNVK